MRIAIVAASPHIIGGHSVQAQALTDGFRQSGHEVAWIPIDAMFPRGCRWIRSVPYARTLLNEALYIASLHALREADVVHVFSASYWSFLLAPAPAIVAARLLRKPVVLHYHSGEAPDHLARWRSARPLLRMADEIVVPSAWLQQVFAVHGLRARVIPNVVFTSQFRFRIRNPLRPTLLSVRNLERHYRVGVTLDAFARIKTHVPEATLAVAGSGSEEPRLRAKAQKLGIDGIRFLGRVEPSRVPHIYDQADVFLNASIVDNQPVSILEAFASGLPVISTPTGDITAMLRGGDAGVIVPPDDPDAMANAVIRLLEEPQRSVELTTNAYVQLNRYAWPEIKEAWVGTYAEVISRARTNPKDETLEHSFSSHV